MIGENNQIYEQLKKLVKIVGSLENRISNLEDRLNRVEQSGRAERVLGLENRLNKIERSEEMESARKDTRSDDIIEREKENINLKKAEEEAEEREYEKYGEENIESEIGAKWLGKIGIVALVFGLAFFLKYAFENDWIGETGRVVMGILAGLGLISLGEFLRKKYLGYAQTLTGGGIAVLYLSIYASSNFYHLIDQTPAFLAMIVVTFAGGFLAIRYEKVGLAGLAILGGLLTPLLLKESLDSQPWLFIYLIILNFSVLGISFFRNWRGLNLLGLLGTLVVFSNWQSTFYNSDQLSLTIFFLTAVFGIYAVASLAHNILFKNKANQVDAALITLNALIYFGISYSLLFKDYSSLMGFFAVAVALVYFILAAISHHFNPGDRYLALFLPLLSIFFITIAAPIQFDGHWVTIAWIVEAAILIRVGFYLNDYRIRMFAWTIFALAAARLVSIDIRIGNLENYSIIFNKRFLTFILGVFSAFSIYHCYGVYQKLIKPEEAKARTIILLIANFLLLFVLSAEVSTFFDKQMRSLPERPDCQIRTYQGWGGKYIINSRCERERQEYEKKRHEVYAERKEIKNAANASLSVFWAVYAIILLAVGIARRNKLLRLMGVGLFGVVIFKVFLYDLWSLGSLYRIISSITLGVILLIASFAYHKYKNEVKEII